MLLNRDQNGATCKSYMAFILALMPTCKLRFFDGKDEERKKSIPTRTLDMDSRPSTMQIEKVRISTKSGTYSSTSCRSQFYFLVVLSA